MMPGKHFRGHAGGSVHDRAIPPSLAESHAAHGGIDRRALRTRSRIQRAHMSLILAKGYEATTVKDICDAAKVGRSTFYAHYAGKEDLRRNCFTHLRRHLADRQRADQAAGGQARAPALPFSLPMFEHARDHLHMYRALVGGAGAAISLGEIRSIVTELVRAEFRGRDAGGPNGSDGDARELSVAYVVGAFMAVLTAWLDDGAKLPPQRVDALFRRFATKGVVP